MTFLLLPFFPSPMSSGASSANNGYHNEAITRTDFKTFQDFYPFYLNEHSNRTNRRLHVIGSTLALLVMFYVVVTLQFKLLWTPFVVGYGFAWVSSPRSSVHPLTPKSAGGALLL